MASGQHKHSLVQNAFLTTLNHVLPKPTDRQGYKENGYHYVRYVHAGVCSYRKTHLQAHGNNDKVNIHCGSSARAGLVAVRWSDRNLAVSHHHCLHFPSSPHHAILVTANLAADSAVLGCEALMEDHRYRKEWAPKGGLVKVRTTQFYLE